MKSSFHSKFKALVVVAGLATAFGAHATNAITFDPTGTPGAGGDITGVGSFDQSPGNALAIGASAQSGVGTSFNLTYQANLGTINNTNNNILSFNGAGGNYFTFVAGFNEVITSNSINSAGVGTLQFGFGASNANAITATNFYYMYAMSAPGNDLAGTGFVGATPILSGHFVGTNYVSAFTASGLGTTPTPLDGSPNGNQYTGVSTIIGAGSTVATLIIDSFNSVYFPDLVAGATTSFINTSQNLAFNQTDPAALMTLNGRGLTTPGVASVGAVNGISGPNTIFQADANQSFATRAVPEPASVALIGLGLVGLGLARRRKAAK